MAFDYEKFCAHRYDMSNPVGMPDLGVVGENPGTGANIVSNPPGRPGGRCAEFNGNNSYYNLGDVAMLNSVTAFTIAFWMNQNVLDVADNLLYKGADANHSILIQITAGGFMVFRIAGGAASDNGYFDYSLQVSVARWHHITQVFNGVGAANVDRLVVYVDGVPATLSFSGTIPAVTTDMSTWDMTIGTAASSFAGRIDDFRIYSTALTGIDAADLHARSRRGATQ